MTTPTTGRSERHPVVNGCLEACRRCGEVLNRVPPELYGNGTTDGSSIGVHIRHCLDHFVCFFDGWSNGKIDYDARERDATLESDPENARTALADIEERLRGISSERLSESVKIRQTVDVEGDASEVESTIGRELAFLSGHAIHHLALIDMMARKEGVTFSESFSVAFSTAAYRVATGQPSR